MEAFVIPNLEIVSGTSVNEIILAESLDTYPVTSFFHVVHSEGRCRYALGSKYIVFASADLVVHFRVNGLYAL